MNTFSFNQFNNYFNTNDRELIVQKINEMVNIIGIPCIHFKKLDTIYNVTDPLYDDIKSKHAMDSTFFEANETRFYTEVKPLLNALSGIGEFTDQNSNWLITMKYEDKPSLGDYIQLILPHSGIKYSFLINNCSNWNDICYSCTIVLAEFDYQISNDDEKLTQYEETIKKPKLEEAESITKKKRGRPRKKKSEG